MAKSFDTISQDIITNILTVNPTIDVKIGSPVRDLFIDVQASQLQDLYTLVDYVSEAQSILTATGNQLDLLAYNNLVTRFQPTYATVTETLIISNGVQAPTLLQLGDQFFTNSPATGSQITFIVAASTLLTPGLVQAVIPLIALNPGSASNVPAQSITQCNYDFVDSVYNASAATGGADTESDSAFAGRIPIFITGIYNNVYNGIVKTLFNIANVNTTPQIITPDNPLSRGPYTVDVYIQRDQNYYGTPVSETAPANSYQYKFLQQPLYELNPINEITIFNPSTNTTTTIAPSINGISQYEVAANGADVTGEYEGSIYAGQTLNWLVQPPTLPYTVNYNVDETVVNAQSAFDANVEVVADVLFKQSNAVPIYISASLYANSSGSSATSSTATITQTAESNLETFFASLTTSTPVAFNNIVFTLLQDTSLNNVVITNFDSTTDIQLVYNGSQFVPSPNNLALYEHPLTPLDTYWEIDATPGPFQPFTIAAQLFIGNRDLISSGIVKAAGINLSASTTKNGVPSVDSIRLSTSWGANIDSYYDKKTQTLVFNFDSVPSDLSTATITLNLVQQYIDISNNLSYLTLAPDLVQPIYIIASTSNLPQPIYATILPAGLDASIANVYKNSLLLTLSPDGVTGDYTIAGPDPTTGLYQINFINQPASTDILQFGLLNPNLSISFTS